MRKLRINSGQLNLTSDEEITLEDITKLGEAAIEAKVPANAVITYTTVNYTPKSHSYPQTPAKWELNISWRMPLPEISVEKDV